MQYNFKLVCEKGRYNKVNGDFAAVHEVDGGLLCIVCDGVGGNPLGDVAANLCAEKFYESFNSSEDKNYLNRIKSSLTKTNNHINTSIKADGKSPASTTADVMFIKNYSVYWGHIGDSRIYNIKNDKIHCLTKDHSMVQKLVDKGFITLKEADSHPNKNVMFTALGNHDNINIDISKMSLSAKDSHKFFLCTDGVFNLVSDEEIQSVVNSLDTEKAVAEITKLVESREAVDDYSFILIDLHSLKKS
jgi:PPM family protein phosphatase